MTERWQLVMIAWDQADLITRVVLGVAVEVTALAVVLWAMRATVTFLRRGHD